MEARGSGKKRIEGRERKEEMEILRPRGSGFVFREVKEHRSALILPVSEAIAISEDDREPRRLSFRCQLAVWGGCHGLGVSEAPVSVLCLCLCLAVCASEMA